MITWFGFFLLLLLLLLLQLLLLLLLLLDLLAVDVRVRLRHIGTQGGGAEQGLAPRSVYGIVSTWLPGLIYLNRIIWKLFLVSGVRFI